MAEGAIDVHCTQTGALRRLVGGERSIRVPVPVLDRRSQGGALPRSSQPSGPALDICRDRAGHVDDQRVEIHVLAFAQCDLNRLMSGAAIVEWSGARDAKHGATDGSV